MESDRFKALSLVDFSSDGVGVRILRVRVRYFTTLRDLAWSAEEEIDLEADASLARLIARVAARHGKAARDYLYHHDKVDPSIYFLVNGKSAKVLSGLDTKLEEGDSVAIVPPIGGGRPYS